MIRSLHIRNIALIEDCTIEFGDKLNVLSGETGAGKSIVIDSLGFVLGARADKTLIRHGTTVASVEAVFDLEDSSIAKGKMAEFGLEEEDTLILYRTMSDAKSEARVNGRLVSLSMLKEIGATLVDILSQHENQELLSVSSHIELLDRYGEGAISTIKDKYRAEYLHLKEIERTLDGFGDEKARARRLDLLKYQIDEIDAADLKEGEEESLLADRERFRNAEKILTAVAAGSSALEGDDTFSVSSAISVAMSALRQATAFDPALEELYTRLDSAYTELNDVADELHSYTESFDFDDAKADFVEKRVDLIRSMKRKYGATVEEILQNAEKYRLEYEELADADAEIERLGQEKEKTQAETIALAGEISKKRGEAAAKLKKELEKELSELGMKGSIFAVSIDSDPSCLGENGFDKVEFMISPNPGEPLRPLSKIISGGEMSRFMLAMKVITARLDGIHTLIFDEVDSGISGKIGEVVAEKLALVSDAHQVIAITHLPQVAAMSDSHYLIEKGTADNVTRTSLFALDEEGVVKEIERLSAGAGVYGALHAKELRELATTKKEKIRKNR